MMQGDEPLDDAPGISTDIRLARMPEKNPAFKRSPGTPDSEPLPKRTLLDPDAAVDMEVDDGIDVDALGEKAEDQKIVCRALLGHDLTEAYSNGRLRLAANRYAALQLLSVDMSEMFSPERPTVLCSSYGLEPAQATDIKNGFVI